MKYDDEKKYFCQNDSLFHLAIFYKICCINIDTDEMLL